MLKVMMNLMIIVSSMLVAASSWASGGSALVSRSGRPGPANADEYMIETDAVGCVLRNQALCDAFNPKFASQGAVMQSKTQLIEPNRQEQLKEQAVKPDADKDYYRNSKYMWDQGYRTASNKDWTTVECIDNEGSRWDDYALAYICKVRPEYHGCINNWFAVISRRTGIDDYRSLAQAFKECGVSYLP